MSERCRAAMMAALALVSLAGGARAATFNFCSQNQLHLGYSSSNQNKVDTLRGEYTNQFASTACDVIVLQETMRRAMETGPLPQGSLLAVVPLPKVNFIYPSTGLLGKTSYKESYAFIVDTTKVTVAVDGSNVPLIYSPSATVANKFARPPAAIMLKTGNGAAGEWTWIVDIHSIWGKSVAERQREAAAMNEFALQLTTTVVDGNTSSRIVIGGDWNLAADNTGFSTMKSGTLAFRVEPNVKTSLTTKGLPSEAYDHFAWSTGVTVSGLRRLDPPNMVTWQKSISDHMAVACQVTHN
jgi:hypothetical protein